MAFERIYEKLQETQRAIEANDSELAEKVGWELCQVFEHDFPNYTLAEYTPAMCLLQFQVHAAVLDLHIMRADPADIAIRGGQLLKRMSETHKAISNWSKYDWKPIFDVVMESAKHVMAFFRKQNAPKPKQQTDKPHMCALCKKKEANKTGSHLVPHQLIGRVFSYDGSNDREKVVVEAENLANLDRERYFGHEVYDDTVNELLGRSFTDEEIEDEMKKTNPLVRDYIFCKECEDRFGVIETMYTNILTGKTKDYNPAIPYLFWMSVIWRMSAGKMGTFLDPDHEEKLRKVLDNCLALSQEDVVTKKNKLGYCAYSFYIAKDTRDEKLAILGPHSPTKPYQALMGRYFINYYTSVSAAHSFCKNHDLPEEDLNDGTSPEKVGELSFIEFWSVKRQILDMIWQHDRNIAHQGGLSNGTVSKYEKELNEFRDTFYPDAEEIGKDEFGLLNDINPHAHIIPRSIQKILLYQEKHKDDFTMDGLVKETGYSEEELSVMMKWYDEMLTKQDEKEKRMKERSELFDNMLNKFI